ncbi:MAG: NADH-quinone oxidoreductase subunit N [Elusimicrobia bacterium]|nr:NADH-quinone oxidoreductase subunit N [Elusimicrobiota bacterium]
MFNLHLIYPEILLSLMALGLLIAELFVAPKHGRLMYHLAWLVSIIALCVVGFTLSDASHAQGMGTLWTVDPFSQFFKIMILLITVFCILMGLEYEALPPQHSGTFVCLLLLASSGLMFLVSSVDLLLTFIALELVSISSFILAGFERRNPKSNEGAMKYFLFGAFSSAVMAYGISLFYGATGGTKLIGLAQTNGPVFILSMLLILLGFGFKASIAPMHFWVPDAYEGAPTPVTTYLSLAPKIATLGAMLRLFSVLLPISVLDLTVLFSILAGLTMIVGNFTAFFQENVKRMLAYSSVAQAGYILIGIVSGNTLGLEGVLLYSFIYIAMNLGAFAVTQAVAQTSPEPGHDPYGLQAFNGLSRRSFGLALAMTFFLLSLSGIPPMAGFIGKFYIFSSAVETGHYGLAALGLVNSVVSVYYYMRIAYHMFFVPSTNSTPVSVGPYLYGSLAVAIAGVLLFGIYPEPLIASVQASAHYLP